MGEKGGLTFTEDILACAIPEAAAPDTHKDSWKVVTAGRKGRRFLMNYQERTLSCGKVWRCVRNKKRRDRINE